LLVFSLFCTGYWFFASNLLGTNVYLLGLNWSGVVVSSQSPAPSVSPKRPRPFWILLHLITMILPGPSSTWLCGILSSYPSLERWPFPLQKFCDWVPLKYHSKRPGPARQLLLLMPSSSVSLPLRNFIAMALESCTFMLTPPSIRWVVI